MRQLRLLHVRSYSCLAILGLLNLGWAGENASDNEVYQARPPRPGSVYLVTERMRLNDDSLLDYERGILFVPLIRSRTDSKVISVEFCRFKSEQDHTDIPPVFKLHGGPGFSGLGAPDQGYLERNVWPVTRDLGADYVVVGQRGIGSSKPNTLLGPIDGFPADQRVSEKDFNEAVQRACVAGKGYWESKGFDLEGFNVIAAAADVNDVRRALGYDRVIVSGTSFGSHWAMAVMRYHPEAVARAVLSGLEGPNHTWDMPSHVLNALERIAQEGEANAEIAKRLSGQGLMPIVSSVLERLDKTPVTRIVRDGEESHTVLLDAHAVRGRILSGMSSRRGIRQWPARVLAWHASDFDEAAKSHLSNSAPMHGTHASFFLLDCGSGISEARRLAVNQDDATRIIGRVNQAYRAAESVWQVDLGERFRENFDSEIPTLLVNGTWDVNTPIENAIELAPHFKNGKLVTIVRGSHAALREAAELSPTFNRGLLRFLRTADHSTVPARVVLPTVEWVVPPAVD